VFSCLHYYRNNTKGKIIPVTISKAIWSVLATFVIYHGTQALVAACDKIQPGILFMIMKSEGDKIKLVQGPPVREKKYAIIAYSQILQEACQHIPNDVITTVVRSLIDLCTSSSG